LKQFKIRKAKQADKKDILNLIVSWKPYHWDVKLANKHFTRFFESNDFPQDRFFVGLMDNNIVSVIGYYHDPSNKISWVEWFYVHKAYSHIGIGKHMLEFVISELKAKKAKDVLVDTSSDEFYEPAIKFYKKMGFGKIDVKDNFYGKGEHQIIMSKSL
jgi:ribosomal protein S18 acetylase RimI-like enzyme